MVLTTLSSDALDMGGKVSFNGFVEETMETLMNTSSLFLLLFVRTYKRKRSHGRLSPGLTGSYVHPFKVCGTHWQAQAVFTQRSSLSPARVRARVNCQATHPLSLSPYRAAACRA